MARFSLDDVENFDSANNQPQGDLKFEFFKLDDNGKTCNIRFMYGPGESFEAIAVHNISADPNRKKLVACLRGPGDPLSTCPLCMQGSKVMYKFYIPCYDVDSKKVLLWERGKKMQPFLKQILMERAGKPLVGAIYRIQRIGACKSMDTLYIPTFISEDNITLDMLPPRPNADGILVLNRNYAELQEFVKTGNLPQKTGSQQLQQVTPENYNNITPRQPYAQQQVPQNPYTQQQNYQPQPQVQHTYNPQQNATGGFGNTINDGEIPF